MTGLILLPTAVIFLEVHNLHLFILHSRKADNREGGRYIIGLFTIGRFSLAGWNLYLQESTVYFCVPLARNSCDFPFGLPRATGLDGQAPSAAAIGKRKQKLGPHFQVCG
jgi:hypothetical protein